MYCKQKQLFKIFFVSLQNHSTLSSLRMAFSRPKRHKVRREDFSATIDYVIFIIRGFPLYTYSMWAVHDCLIYMILLNNKY